MDNKDAMYEFGLGGWEDKYAPYERALIDLQYQVNRSQGGKTRYETGPSKEAVISLDPKQVLEHGDASEILSSDESPLGVVRRESVGILQRLLSADDVLFEFNEITGSEIEAIVSPFYYKD
jgi:hypothetical protein